MQPDSAPRLRLRHLVLLLPVATAALLAWHSLSDRDVWFHARAGHDLLAEGRLVQTNRYSFTAPDHPWLNHEWLFQAVVAATAPALPPAADDPVTGWSLLRLGLVLALVLVLVGGDGLLAAGAPPGRLLLVAGAALGGLGLLWTRLTLRPELVSYLLLAVQVRAVGATLAPDAPPAPWRAWLDPRRAPGRATLATLLWAQVHGFAALAPLVWLLGLAALLLPPRAPGRGAAARRGAVGLALAVLALGLTPNGPAALLLPLRAVGQFGGDRPDLGGMISELVPLLRTPDALGATLTLFRWSLVWAALWSVSQWGRVPPLRVLLAVAAAAGALPPLRVLLAVAAAAGALAAQRGLGVWAVAFVLLHTGTAWPPRVPGRGRLPAVAPRAGRAGTVAAGLLLAVLCALWWPRVANDGFYLGEGVARRFGAGLGPAHAPVGAAAALHASGARTVVANVDAAGLVLATGGTAVFIDGRTEAYPPEIWRQYADLRDGGAGARRVLARWRPEAVLLAYGSGAFLPLATALAQDPAWTVRAVDGAAVLLVPGAAAPAAEPAAAAADLLARADDPGRPSARRADLCLAAARTWQLAGDHEAAAASLARGAALRPDHPQVQHNLGNALLAEERFAPALAAFAAAFAANGRQAGSALNAGVCALRLGQREEARAWFARAVAVDPDRFEAWVNLAVAARALGDRDEARRALERALALRPGDARLRELLRGL